KPRPEHFRSGKVQGKPLPEHFRSRKVQGKPLPEHFRSGKCRESLSPNISAPEKCRESLSPTISAPEKCRESLSPNISAPEKCAFSADCAAQACRSRLRNDGHVIHHGGVERGGAAARDAETDITVSCHRHRGAADWIPVNAIRAAVCGDGVAAS